MFHRKKQREFRINEFTIFGAFVAVALFGLVYGAYVVVTGTDGIGSIEEELVDEVLPVAPTDDEYRADARDVLAPFVAQSAAMDETVFSGDTGALRQLVEKTQERLLRVRVPASFRTTHLSFILLLDQWKRALDGSSADRDVVLDKTRDLVAENAWIQE